MDEEIHEWADQVCVNRTIEEFGGTVNYLWGDSLFQEYFAHYVDLESVLPGDVITLKHTGGIRILQTYPSHFLIDNGHPVGASITKGTIVKAPVEDGAIILPESMELDYWFADFCIDPDLNPVSFEGLDEVYLACSALNEGRVLAAYSFDPRQGASKSAIVFDRGFHQDF